MKLDSSFCMIVEYQCKMVVGGFVVVFWATWGQS